MGNFFSQDFEFDIKHRKCEHHANVDAPVLNISSFSKEEITESDSIIKSSDVYKDEHLLHYWKFGKHIAL